MYLRARSPFHGSNHTADMDAYVKQTQNISTEDIARRLDYRSKLAVEELLTTSSFMKKCLIYLAAMATLSIYLKMISKA